MPHSNNTIFIVIPPKDINIRTISLDSPKKKKKIKSNILKVNGINVKFLNFSGTPCNFL